MDTSPAAASAATPAQSVVSSEDGRAFCEQDFLDDGYQALVGDDEIPESGSRRSKGRRRDPLDGADAEELPLDEQLMGFAGVAAPVMRRTKAAGLDAFRTVVIKVGSHSLVDADTGDVNVPRLSAIISAVCKLEANGIKVIIVTSGALAMGGKRLGKEHPPTELSGKQAFCAVGQGRLIHIYEDLFELIGRRAIAQVLVTRADLGERKGFLSALNTFRELLELDCIPIVNENDTVSVEGLCFEDNDTLAALVANMVEADYLLILTNVDGVFTSDPMRDPDAELVPWIDYNDASTMEPIDTMAVRDDKSWTSGGMATMLAAARLASAGGAHTVITNADKPNNILEIVLYSERVGTHFPAAPRRIRGKKRWLASVKPVGRILLDAGASGALSESLVSIFAAGVKGVEGDFLAQAPVELVAAETGFVLGHALTNYGSKELAKIKGKKSDAIAATLGYLGAEAVCHKEWTARFVVAES